MAVINGTSMLVYVKSGSEAYEPIAQATSHTLNITQQSRDTSNDVEFGYERLMDVIIDRSECKLLFADVSSSDDNTPATGSEFYASGSFVFSSFDLTAPQEDNVTYSAAFELAGEFGIFNQ